MLYQATIATPLRNLIACRILSSPPGRRRSKRRPSTTSSRSTSWPAFEQAFADHTAEVAAIVNDPSEPDFDNTITALERSGKLLTKVSSVFYALVGAHSNPELLAIESDVALRQARHWNPIMMNGVLFGRIAQTLRPARRR